MLISFEAAGLRIPLIAGWWGNLAQKPSKLRPDMNQLQEKNHDSVILHVAIIVIDCSSFN